MMPDLADFEVGQTVKIGEGQVGRVHFVGHTHFAPGDWIGLVFDEPIGKNDGSVQGKKYFDCPAGHGMFVRPGVAEILDQPTPRASRHADAKVNGVAVKPRTSVVGTAGSKRASTAAANSKRQSINASSPTPTARTSRLTAPSKSPTKQLGSSASSATSTPRTNTPTSSTRRSSTIAPLRHRTSMAPPPAPSSSTKTISRPSTGPLVNGTRGKTASHHALSAASGHRLSVQSDRSETLRSTSGESKSSLRSEPASIAETAATPALSPPDAQEDWNETLSQSKTAELPHEDADHADDGAAPDRPISPNHQLQRSNGNMTTLRKENEDLAAKMRVIEKKRIEDRESLRALDKAQADRDRFEGIIQKLQAKYQLQQQELADFRRQLKNAEVQVEALEATQAENETLQEMATLDKEMAEEMAETAKLELQSLRQKQEELELEVEVLREENIELGKEMSPEERTSQGWLQLERSNERYREALLRLRDVTQQQESDLRAQINDLDSDLQDFAKLKEESSSVREKMLRSDANVEDLRQQLESALGAEDIIEELTSKNLTLNDKMDQLRTTVEELESLREINDELEINHIETEKQLQDEIDYQEGLLAEEAKKYAVQDGNVQDLEYTVSRFRDLVTSLQNDLEDMKASQQLTETQANDLSLRSRAIEDLNLKMQNSAAKAQVKAISIQLEKLKAQESAQHLEIIELFLPESFKSERDSVQAFLLYRRLEFKTKMLCGFLRERVNDNDSRNHDGRVFDWYALMARLTWISSTCRRFSRTLETCDLETFRRLGAASFDLVPVERAIDRWVAAFERNELNAGQSLLEVSSHIAMIQHLAEVHISDELENYADLLVHLATVVQCNLDIATLLLSHLKVLVEDKVASMDQEGTDINEEDLHNLLDSFDSALSQTRSSKITSGKALAQIEDLRSRRIVLNPSSLPTIEQCIDSTEDLSGQIDKLGRRLFTTPTELDDERTVSAHAFATELSSGPSSIPSVLSKARAAASLLHGLHALSFSIAQTVEFVPSSTQPPWKLLADHMRAATADLHAREHKISQLKDVLTEKDTRLALKEKAAEEMAVKLEVFERRMGESGEYKDRIKSLEDSMQKSQRKERETGNSLVRLQHEYRRLESDHDHIKKTMQEMSLQVKSGPGPVVKQDKITVDPDSSLRRMHALQAEIEVLQSSIRYLSGTANNRQFTDYQDFLSEPVARGLPTVPPLASEAQDVLREMLVHITEPSRQVATFRVGSRENRFRWRPAKETIQWQHQRQREEWGEWREWRDDVAKQRSRPHRWGPKLSASDGSTTKPALTELITIVGAEGDVTYD